MSKPRNRFTAVVTPLGLFILAMGVRLLSWHSVFQKTGVHPNGYDAYYHLRRIRYTIDHFPEVLRFDPWINYPHGGQPIWSPAFDWLIAALLRPLPWIDQPEQLERLAAWIPPLLGAATVVLLYFIACRFYSRSVAVMAASALALLPGHSIYSRLGNIDHHVLVAAVSTIMLALGMRLFREPADNPKQRAGLLLSAALGLSMAALVLVWPGSLLHVGVMQIAMIVLLLNARRRQVAITWAIRFSLVHLVSCLAVYPLSMGNEWVLWGRFSPVVLSNFQPLYFFAAALVFGSLATLWHFGIGASHRGLRALTAGALGLLVMALLFSAIPELAAGIGDALSWFSKDEEFQSAVSESAPLISARVGVARAKMFLSSFVFIVPLMIAFLVWQNRRRPDQLLLMWWSAAFFAASLVQWRFVNTYSVAHSLLIALTLQAVYDCAAPRLIDRRRFWGAATVAAIGLCLVFFPALQAYGPHFENVLRSLRGEDTPPVGTLRDASFLTAAARFLRDHSPAIEETPYSVIGPWGTGHILKYVGKRPVLQDNFGDDVAPENFRLVEEYFSARREEDALSIVEPMDARYVLVRPVGSGHSKGYRRDSLLARLYVSRGNGGSEASHEGRILPAFEPLKRHRLIYQSEPSRIGEMRPFLMWFEIVAGAKLVGRSDPGAKVQVRLSIVPRLGTRFEYTTGTRANKDGVYQIRLPYSNESLSPNVQIAPQYIVRVGPRRAAVTIPEAAVLNGEEVEGPNFETSSQEAPFSR